MAYYFRQHLDTATTLAALDNTFATNSEFACSLSVDGENFINFKAEDVYARIAAKPWREQFVLLYDMKTVGTEYWETVFNAGIDHLRLNQINATMMSLIISLDGKAETEDYEFLVGFTFATEEDQDRFKTRLENADLNA
jgi:hypothetical protein